MSDFLKTYIAYTTHQESPSVFHSWVAFSVVSAALQRRCWLDRGFAKLYPNIYTVLVGPSGRQKKSTAIKIGKELLIEANLDVAIREEKMTPEGLLLTMNRIIANPATNVIAQDSSMFIIAPEFPVLIGTDKARASAILQFLTTVYDSPDTMNYITVAHGARTLNNVYTTLMSGSTQEWLNVIPMDSTGGFLSRVVFVYSNERKRIPKPRTGPERPDLLRMLQAIGRMSGEFSLAPDADAYHDDWYMQIPESRDLRKAGFMERLSDHVLKLSCIVAAGRDTMVVSLPILQTAIHMLDSILPGMDHAMAYIGTTSFSQIASAIVTHLKLNGTVTNIEFYNELQAVASVEEIDKAIDDLIARRTIKLVSAAGTLATYSVI